MRASQGAKHPGTKDPWVLVGVRDIQGNVWNANPQTTWKSGNSPRRRYKLRVVTRKRLKYSESSSTGWLRDIETTVFDPASVFLNTLVKSETQPASVVSINH